MIKVRHKMLSEPIAIKNETITNIVFETSDSFYTFLKDLNDAYLGNTENLDFIEGEKEYNFAKKAVFIPDVVTYDINTRRVRNDLLKSVNNLVDEEFEKELEIINRQLQTLMKSRISLWGDIFIREEITTIDYLKLFDLEIDDADKSLIEKIMTWIKSFLELNRINFFIFVNLFDFLEKEEVVKLQVFCQQEKITILVITRHNFINLLPSMRQFIVDKDTCIIPKNI